MSKVLLAGCNLGSAWRSRGVPGVDKEGKLTPPPTMPEPVIDEPGEYKISVNQETGGKKVKTFDPETGGNKITTIDPGGEVVDVEYVPLNEKVEQQREVESALITAETYDKSADTVKKLATFAPLGGLALLALLL